MKVLVISDSHKDLFYAGLAIRHTMKEGLDIVIHCGDHIEDARRLERQFPKLKFYYVAGNCDGWFLKEKERTKVVEIEDKKILITHGDCHNIKFNYQELFKDMKNKKAHIGVCGHTHMAHKEIEKTRGLLAINPGSISLPRDSAYPSYAVLNIKKDQETQVKHMIIIEKTPREIPIL